MSLRLGLALSLLALIAVAIAVLIATGAVKECPVALFGSEHEVDSGALCRTEFLLNRYQALIGALIALGAAIYATRPVWHQLRLLSVQAASDLLPRLKEEAEELSADEGLVATARQIVSKLREIQFDASGYPSGSKVARTVGLFVHVRTAIDSMKSGGAIQHFASRTTISSEEQARRRILIVALDLVSLTCEKIMSIVNPPAGIQGYGGVPTEAYYEENIHSLPEERARGIA
jgi:hypothetical protein